MAINKEVRQVTKIQIDYLKSKKYEIKFGGKLFTRTQEIEQIKLLVIGRDSNVESKFNLSQLKHLKNETIRKFGLNRYEYKVNLNLNELFENKSLDNDVYDLFFEIKYRNSDEN